MSHLKNPMSAKEQATMLEDADSHSRWRLSDGQAVGGPLKGERLVRFAYATDGTARRGPVTLRASDLAKLRKGLEKTPSLKEALLG